MSKPNHAVRGAYLLAAAAVRTEVKKLGKLAHAGVAVDPAQHGTLSAIAEQLYLLGIGSEEPPARISLVDMERDA
jgi:hypothetical protein